MKQYLVLALVAMCLSTHGALAEPAPFPEFSAKRVKPPSSGVKKRINVQITPQAPSPPKAPTGTTPQPRAKGGETLAWFWSDISPSLDAQGPGRLEPALVRLLNPPPGQGLAAPRLQDLQSIAERHGKDILLHTVGTRVSPALALAVISVESAGRVDAQSSVGAQGLMQLMPATAERFGVSDRTNPEDNINGGVAYLDWLLKEFSRDPVMALAGYNAGENAVKKNAGVPPYAETRDYVPKVLAAWTVARNLCVTPPLLVSDGCVFRPSPKMQKPAAKPATNKEG